MRAHTHTCAHTLSHTNTHSLTGIHRQRTCSGQSRCPCGHCWGCRYKDVTWWPCLRVWAELLGRDWCCVCVFLVDVCCVFLVDVCNVMWVCRQGCDLLALSAHFIWNARSWLACSVFVPSLWLCAMLDRTGVQCVARSWLACSVCLPCDYVKC